MTHYNRQLRTVKNLVKKIEKLGGGDELLSLTRKLKGLISKLIGVIPMPYLKKALGSLALIIGLSTYQHTYAQSFATPMLNPFGITNSDGFGQADPEFADLDNDGDLDLLRGTYISDDDDFQEVMVYYENIGTPNEPNFASGVINPFGLEALNDEYILASLVDIDGDSKTDLITKLIDGNFLLRKNIGTISEPLFADPINFSFGLEPFVTGSLCFHTFADIDSDSDIDLFTGITNFNANTYEYDPNIIFYENIGSPTIPNFEAPVFEPFNIESPSGDYSIIPTFGDIDQDGDLDLLGGEFVGQLEGNFLFYENVGDMNNPIFTDFIIDPFGLSALQGPISPEFADMDGDGDLDLWVGSFNDLYYFENIGAIGIGEYEAINALTISPNPAQDFLKIESKNSITHIHIRDLSGSLISEHTEYQILSVGHLKSGMYFITLYSNDELINTLKFIKE